MSVRVDVSAGTRTDVPATGERLPHRRDGGTVLTMTLVLLTVGGLIIASLLGYVSTVLRTRPVLEDRLSTAETAESALRFGIHQQRVSGPDACWADSAPVVYNDLTAQVSCSVVTTNVDNPLLRGRFGVISTASANVNGGNAIRPISTTMSGGLPELLGDVFISGGEVVDGIGVVSASGSVVGSTHATPVPGWTNPPNTPTYSNTATPGACVDVAGAAFAGELVCSDVTWVERAGHSVDGTTWQYPQLPNVPERLRSATPFAMSAASGTCNVFFPGRYLDPLTLNGGDYYFASGIYYFEDSVTITGGARVVAGEGRTSGCLLDADAALDAAAPIDHRITGGGATFLLGDDAQLRVERASLYMNRRLSTPSTRATEGVSIRTVVTAPIDTADLYVPADTILPAEGETPVAATSPSGSASYTSSTLGLGGLALDVDRSIGGPVASGANPYDLLIDGQVFTPNAGVRIADSTSHYGLQLTGGVVATTIELDLASPPTTTTDWTFGAQSGSVQSVFRFDAEVTSDRGRVTTATAFFELNIDGSYALNSMSVDVGDSRPGS